MVSSNEQIDFMDVGEQADAPAFMQYPDIWGLGEDAGGPGAVKDYLAWTLDDADRAHSAAEHLRWLAIGMHFLTVANRVDADGRTLDKVELNFWNETYPPGTGVGGHAHSRDMDLKFFSDPAARQEITRIGLLPPETPRLPRLPVDEQQLAVLSKVEAGDGFGPVYNPQILGRRLVLQSTTVVPPLAHQRFSSLDIHEVRYEGPGTGVTVQRQGAYETDELNTNRGLTTYKGLTIEEAEKIQIQREHLAEATAGTGRLLVASTVLVRDLDFRVDQMQDRAEPVGPERYESLALGAIHSLERLARSQAVA